MRIWIWVLALGTLPALSAADDRKITLETVKGETIEGTFRGATEEEVSLEVAGQALRVPLANVRYLSFTGRLAGGSASVAGDVPAGTVEDALAALDALARIVEVGVLRETYSQKLIELLPRVNAFVDSPGDDWKDVRNALALAVYEYRRPLGTEMADVLAWNRAPQFFRRAQDFVDYARSLYGEPDERFHTEPERLGALLAVGATRNGRLGAGDRLDDDMWVESYSFDVEGKTPLVITSSCTPCDHVVTLYDARDKILGHEGLAQENTIAKTLSAGTYTVALRAKQAGRFTLRVETGAR